MGKPRVFYGYAIVSASFVIMVVATGAFYSFAVFFNPLLTEFGWTRAVTSGAFSLSLLFSGLLAMVAGRLNDKFGPRLILTVSGLLLGLGYLLLSRVTTVWQFYLFYGVLFGTGIGGVFAPLFSTVARWFSMRRGMMSGIVGIGVGTGVTVVPLSVSWLIRAYDWRVAAVAVGAAAMVVMISAAQFLRRDPQGQGLQPDGVSELPSGNVAEGDTGLTFHEAVRTGRLWMLCAIYLGAGFAIYTILTHIVVHAIGLGMSEGGAASVLATIGGVSIAGRFMIGSISDRIGGRAAIISGLIPLSAVIFGLIVAREPWLLYLIGVIFGFTYGGVLTLQSLLVAEVFGLRAHGVLYGVLDIGATIGGIIGPVLAGYIFDTTGSYKLAFLLCGAASIAALVLAVLLRSSKAEKAGRTL